MELPTCHAIRLIFEYEGHSIRLVGQQAVEMDISGYDMSGVDRPGYYVETRNAAGAALARVAAKGAFEGNARAGVFAVVVPAAHSASHVVLTRIACAAGEACGTSARSVCGAMTTDIAAFALSPRTKLSGTP